MPRRMKSRSISLIGCCVLLTVAPAARAGTVTSVTASQRTIAVGVTITVKVNGTNPCGAAHIIYGDGDAITYAITGLPVDQTHVYQKAGTYTIIARGMGNCDGEATTTLTVSAPPESPPPARSRASITAVEITPSPGRVQEPIAVVTRGTGPCVYDVQYGDGTTEQVNARLPEDTHHTYANPGRYVVIVRPNPPCVGKFSEVLQVVQGAPAEPARITHIVASPTPGGTGQPLAVAVHGSGTCPYDIAYGDGNTQEVNGPLPQSTSHVYSQPGRYAIVVKAHPPCAGRFTEAVQIGSATPTGPRITRVSAGPTPATPRQPVTLTVDGAGTCAVTIDYGDGNSDSKSMALPESLRHVYSAPGVYTVVVAPAREGCTGSGRVTFEVRRSRYREEVQ